MSVFYEVSTCLEIDSEEQPSFVHGIARSSCSFFCVDKSILVCKDFTITSSLIHASSIVQLAVAPDNSLVFFIDDLGTLNLFLPDEDRGLFNLSEFGRARFIRLVATDDAQFNFFLVTDENILCWRNLDITLFKSIFHGDKSRQLAKLLSKVIKVPCSAGSSIASAVINSLVWMVEIGIPEGRTLMPDDASPCFERLKDPLGYLSIQPKFKKTFFIQGTGYCLALSTEGLLYLFNVVAGLCLGTIHALSGIRDFSIGQLFERGSDGEDAYPGLPPCCLILLRTPDENDEPLSFDAPNTASCSLILETLVFPKLERLNQYRVKSPVWLLSDLDVSSAQLSETSGNQIFFAEFIQPAISPTAASEAATEARSFIRIQSLQTIDPTQSVYRLIKRCQFNEARRLVDVFKLGSDVNQTLVIAELEWTLKALTDLSPSELLETVRNTDTVYLDADGTQVCVERICQRMLSCLKDAEDVWHRQDIAERLLRVCAPTSSIQMELFLLLKEKLQIVDSVEDSNMELYTIKVYASLKRLKTFLLLNGPDLFSPSSWNEFLSADIYALFAHYLTAATGHHKEDPCDPSKAFLIWNLYKGDLMEFLNRTTLEMVCNRLLRRSLTFTLDDSEDCEIRQKRFVAAETAVHRWLRNELLSSVIRKCPDAISTVVNFVIQRVKQLEACDPPYVVNISVVASSVNVPVCPFSWPSTALSWTESFLEAASPTDTGEEALYRTPGDKVNAYMTGLGSLDPAIDPLADLRKLAMQLRTIELLRKVYDCRLTLENCDAAAELSIAYRILDVPFNLGMTFSGGVDPLTAKYLEDRKIDLQTFYQGYAMDLCRRIKMAIEQSSHSMEKVALSDDATDPVTCIPMRKTESITPDPKVLVHQACVVADWITVPLCRIKVVTNLATLVPLPWPSELLTLANSVLDHARAHGLLSKRSVRLCPATEHTYSAYIPQLLRLERLASVARVHEILARYSLTDISFTGTCIDNAHDVALQTISCIMYNFSNPFSGNATSSDTMVPDLDERVVRDCEVIARELIASADWAVWFARTRMQLVLEMASNFYETESDELSTHSAGFEQRCSFVLLQLDSTVYDLFMELCGSPCTKSFPKPARFLLLKRFLGMTCLRYIESACRLLPSEESVQTAFLAELGVCIANSVVWSHTECASRCTTSQSHSVSLVESAKFSEWLHKHRSDIESVADMVRTVGSLRQLPLSSLSERCCLVRNLTSCHTLKCRTTDSMAIEEQNLLPLKRVYEFVLPDLSPADRDELLVWNWCKSCLQLACRDVEADPNCSVVQLQPVSILVLQTLRALRKSVICASQTTLHPKSMERQTKLSPPATPRSMLAACGFCVRLWDSPLGHLGSLLQLWRDTVIPLLVALLSRTSQVHPDDFAHSLSVVSQAMSSLLVLITWVVGRIGSTDITQGNHCSCHLQIVLPQIQGLLQILQAYDVFFAALTSSQSSPTSDSLDQWTFSPMFDETATACTAISLSCITTSLRWLSDFFSWLLSLHPQQAKRFAANTAHSDADDARVVDLDRLLDAAVDVASTWASVYNLRLRASVPLLIGLQRLMRYKLRRDLWTEDSQPALNDNGVSTLSSSEPSSGYQVRWSALCARWIVSSLEAVLNPADGKYLDQVLVLSLALAAPIEDATSVVRSVVASGGDAPKKIKAVAGIMYVFAVIAPERGSSFLSLSQSMIKTWGWRTALKPYGLNLSHLLSRGADEAAFEAVLNKLCRIVPSPKQSPGEAPVGILLPSDPRRMGDPFSSTHTKSENCRLLPPLRVIVCFAKDFSLSLKTALLNHLKALFTSLADNSIASDTNQPTLSFEFPQVTAFGDNSVSSHGKIAEESNVNTSSFRAYHQLLLRRADLVLRRLMAFGKRRSFGEMVTLLRGFYSATSPYEYERLHFLLSWIQLCSPESLEPQRIELLKLLENYRRLSAPTDHERDLVLSKTGEDLLSFSTTETIHPLSHVRMPFHPLLSKSPPMNIISPEVTMDTITFWLKVDSLMQWNISDSLRLMTAKNLVSQYDRAGLLPLIGTRKSGPVSVSTAAGWDRALPCQMVLNPLFTSLRSLLESVTDQAKVMPFLAMLTRQVLYGPHRLALLQLAKDLAATWLEKLDVEARLVYPTEESTWRPPRQSEGLAPLIEDAEDADDYRTENRLEQRLQWTRMALERAEASYKQLAMEACLYQYHLADWEEVNLKLSSPKELIQALLSKVASILTRTSNTVDSSLPVSQLSLRQRLLKALPKLASLADIDYADLGSRILLNRLHLPSHILSLNGTTTGSDANMPDQSILLDTSIGEGRPGLCDITLNATMTQADTPAERTPISVTDDRDQLSEEDFVVAELILRDPVVRRELLPNLHAFVFTGDPSTYLVARWRAARCVLRTQLGVLIWPRLSVAELQSTLLRLSILAECRIPAHQRLLIDSSETHASSKGGTFTAISSVRILACVKQLLASSTNLLQATELSGKLVVDFDLVERQTVAKLLSMIHQHIAKHTTSYILRIIDYLLSTGSPWKSLCWLGSTVLDQSSSTTTQFLSDLMHHLISSATGGTSGHPARPGQLFSRLVLSLIGWPIPDRRLEQALARWATFVIPAAAQSRQHRSSGGLPMDRVLVRIWLLASVLRLLAVSCSTEQVSMMLNECIERIENWNNPREQMRLTTEALEWSELHLTADCFNV